MFRLLHGLVLVLVSTLAVAGPENTTRLADIAIHPERNASAVTVSLNHSVISSQLLARIDTIAVGVSQAVKRGDLLLQLNCEDYTLRRAASAARLAATRANLNLAEQQLQRTRQLLDQNLSSREQYDIKNAAYSAQKAVDDEAVAILAQADLDVDRCSVRAPFDAVVVARNAAEGQLASVGTELITLVDTGRVELSAGVGLSDVPQLLQVAEAVFDYGPQLRVKLHNVGAAVDKSTRNQELRFRFVETAAMPGTAGKLLWRDPRPYVPAKYLAKRGGILGVFIAVDGVAVFHALPDAIFGRPALAGDLDADTLVVTNAIATLNAGDAL